MAGRSNDRSFHNVRSFRNVRHRLMQPGPPRKSVNRPRCSIKMCDHSNSTRHRISPHPIGNQSRFMQTPATVMRLVSRAAVMRGTRRAGQARAKGRVVKNRAAKDRGIDALTGRRAPSTHNQGMVHENFRFIGRNGHGCHGIGPVQPG